MSEINPECDRIDKLPDATPPHIVLGIPEDSDEKVKNIAYRKLALFCHPDRPNNTDKELFKRIFQKITAANEAFTDYSPRDNEQEGSTVVSKANTALDEGRRQFGMMEPEVIQHINMLKLWLEYLVDEDLYFTTKNLSFEDINRYLKYVDFSSGEYINNKDIRSLVNKLYASGIWNLLYYNNRVLTDVEQIWIISKLADYIQNGRRVLHSAEYEQIIMSDILEERLPSVKERKRYGWIIEYKQFNIKKKEMDIKKQKLADAEGESRLKTLRTMVDTVKKDKNPKNVKSLNQFIRQNIEDIFDFLPKETQTEIESLIEQLNPQSSAQSSGGYSVGSRRKQPTRRLRKTQYRRKRNNRKSKKAKQV
jgi:curved DNA-binding protein CbpA